MSDDQQTVGTGAGAAADGGALREARSEARFVELEIKLAEMEFGQQQIDEVVLRQSEDIRRLTALVRRLDDRLAGALGEPAAGGGATSGPPADPAVDPERPPHYSGPA